MKTAITGGIGSGKSYVCSLLLERGIKVFDCDAVAKQIMQEDITVRKNISKLIGRKAYSDGKLNKKVVTTFLLASHQNALALNNVIHPAVADAFLNSKMDWMECAILYESGFDKLVNNVIVVTAPQEVRIKRIMLRDGISRDNVKAWFKQQMSQEELRRIAQYEIVNDGFADVQKQLDNVIKKLELKE